MLNTMPLVVINSNWKILRNISIITKEGQKWLESYNPSRNIDKNKLSKTIKVYLDA